jgi:hypothetical protein
VLTAVHSFDFLFPQNGADAMNHKFSEALHHRKTAIF